jgi:hypothetical protein
MQRIVVFAPVLREPLVLANRKFSAVSAWRAL